MEAAAALELTELMYEVSKVFDLVEEIAVLGYDDDPCMFVLEGGLGGIPKLVLGSPDAGLDDPILEEP